MPIEAITGMCLCAPLNDGREEEEMGPVETVRHKTRVTVTPV